MSRNQKISFSQILESERNLTRKKLESKLPLWAGCSGIELPQSLPMEQCSSALCADFKANLLRRILPATGSIADLTGGFGSDSWAFSRVFDRVHYFEKNEALCQLARKNFPLLFEKDNRKANIECTNVEVDSEVIANLSVDCIYADPARRSESGKKVFLIEDCTPDVRSLLPYISKASPYLLIKYSPMADITMLRERLSVIDNYPVKSIGVVGIAGEVKELLVLMGRSDAAQTGLPELFIADVKDGTDEILPLDGMDKDSVLLESLERLGSTDHLDNLNFTKCKVLLEPSAILLKSGYQNAICSVYAAKKIGQDCHLYVAPENAAQECADKKLENFVKRFEIVECCELNKAALKDVGSRYPKAEVTAKGLHLKSEELASILKCRSGVAADGKHYHIFGVGNGHQKALIVTKKLS